MTDHGHHHGDLALGISSTLVAFAAPESWVAMGERWIYAVLIAITSTFASRMVNYLWATIVKRIEKRKKDNHE